MEPVRIFQAGIRPLLVALFIAGATGRTAPLLEPEPVAVLGLVKKEGLYALKPGMRVHQALQAAGGFAASANREKVLLRRLQAPLRTINGALALKKDDRHNLVLRAGDTLLVRETSLHASGALDRFDPARVDEEDPSAKVALVGEVVRPGTYIYEPVMVRDALEAAGGLNQDAEPKRILVRRGYLIDPSSSRTITYDFEKVVTAKAPDIALLPGDAIEVPRRGRKTFTGTIGGAINRLGRTLRPLTKPLLTAGAAAASGAGPAQAGVAAVGAAAASNNRPRATGGRVPTDFEIALLQALASEKPEVRERIYSRARAYMEKER
ncbi:MAG TPA: SLBB domain-containing protein [Fimbriimonadaceae bacterium]|nr:SLBB domain-containing protein [Fimbriimonadaceae bacterium]